MTAALIVFAVLTGLYILISQAYRFYALWLRRNHQIDSELALSNSHYPTSVKEMSISSPVTTDVRGKRSLASISRPQVPPPPTPIPTPPPPPPPKPQPTFSSDLLRTRQEPYGTTPPLPAVRASPARTYPGRPRAMVNFASNHMAPTGHSRYDELRTFDPTRGSEASPEETESVPLTMHGDIAGPSTQTRHMISPTFTVGQLHTPTTAKRAAAVQHSRQTTPNLYQSATASLVSEADSPSPDPF